jgi:hypothetical protein
VSQAIDDPNRKTQEGLSLANSIREHVKAMGNGADRLAFLADAIAQGDKQTVAAVLHAPGYLSGLSAANLDLLRLQAADRFAPLEHRQQVAAAKILDQVTAAGAQLMVRFQKAIALKSSAKAKAEEALKSLVGNG